MKKYKSQLKKCLKEGKAMDCNESVVIMSAVRYMLGRSSYGVGCVVDYVKSQKDRLTQSNKEAIIRDITERIAEQEEITYQKDWLDLVEYLK